MKKLILSGGILTLLVAAFALMSLTTPKAKAHPRPKKPTTITFTIYNNSTEYVSFTFKNSGGFGPTNVSRPGIDTTFSITPDTYQVILNNARRGNSFHMVFNTGENYYSPGHTFPAIVVSSTHTTYLDLY